MRDCSRRRSTPQLGPAASGLCAADTPNIWCGLVECTALRLETHDWIQTVFHIGHPHISPFAFHSAQPYPASACSKGTAIPYEQLLAATFLEGLIFVFICVTGRGVAYLRPAPRYGQLMGQCPGSNVPSGLQRRVGPQLLEWCSYAFTRTRRRQWGCVVLKRPGSPPQSPNHAGRPPFTGPCPGPAAGLRKVFLQLFPKTVLYAGAAGIGVFITL